MPQPRDAKLSSLKRRFGALWVLSFVLAAGCNTQYSAEKLFWRANQIKREIAKSPEATPPGLYVKAKEAFEAVIARFPKTEQAIASQMAVGDLLALQKDYAGAEAAYRAVPVKFQVNKNMEAQVHQAVARLKEKQGLWDEAQEIYQKITRDYDQTLIALSIPVYIARRFAKEKDIPQANKYYADAIKYYLGVESKYPRTRLALAAMDIRFQCYADRGIWPEALQVLDLVRETFPNTPEAQRAELTKKRIEEGLQKQAQAREKKEPAPKAGGTK